MPDEFRAFRVHRDAAGIAGRLETLQLDDLTDGSIVVRVEYSSINYKDALGATGTAPILQSYPLVAGIDLAGEVLSSEDAAFSPGDKVVGLGSGLGETRDGGYAEIARVDASMIVPIPDSLDARSAMILGTAGFSAALAVHRLERNGQRPELGPILVTGASGGVGSLAIDMLAGLGYEVVALTGKRAATEYLKTLGASEVLDRQSLTLGKRPLEHARWGGAVDNLGGEMLSWITRSTKRWGSIASIGLAAGATFETSVMPFILRSVSLLGVNLEAGPELRAEIWQRLNTDLKPTHLDAIATREVSLDELPNCFAGFLDAAHTGRTLVKLA